MSKRALRQLVDIAASVCIVVVVLGLTDSTPLWIPVVAAAALVAVWQWYEARYG